MDDLHSTDEIISRRRRRLNAARSVSLALAVLAVVLAACLGVFRDHVGVNEKPVFLMEPLALFLAAALSVLDLCDLFRNLRYILCDRYEGECGRIWLCVVGFVKSAAVFAFLAAMFAGGGEMFDHVYDAAYRTAAGLGYLAQFLIAVYYVIRAGAWMTDRRS